MRGPFKLFSLKVTLISSNFITKSLFQRPSFTGSYQLAYQRWFDKGFFDKELSMQEASKKDIISALDALHLPTPEILIAHSKTELDTSPNEKS